MSRSHRWMVSQTRFIYHTALIIPAYRAACLQLIYRQGQALPPSPVKDPWGSYDVTVTGSSGSLTHSRHVTVTITTAQPESPDSPGIFGLAPMWFYGGLVALAIMLASILALRRRSKRNGKP